MEDTERDISEFDSGGGQSELADYDNHPADAGSETFEKEKDVAILDNYRDVLGKMDEALGKIDRGTYGNCDRCGREIMKGRLDAIPYAIYCVECQDIIEGQ
jgi:RNA polymerase-binding transcription factor DksA